MRRFVIAFGYTIHSFGRSPFYRKKKVSNFEVLFRRELRPGEWD